MFDPTTLVFVGLLAAAALLAYANGANDNFKAVATVYGSRILGYERALAWATASQILGSLAALALASELIRRFSGKGLVPDALVGRWDFLLAVGLGAALTVLLATRFGLPISTTHSLTGALLGGGLMLAAGAVDLRVLGGRFALPLLISPFLALLLTLVLYLPATALRRRLALDDASCVCLDQGAPEVVAVGSSRLQIVDSPPVPQLRVDHADNCRRRYAGSIAGVPLAPLVDAGHLLSSGMLGFARGLNDTPKVLGVLFAAQVAGIGAHVSQPAMLVAITLAMATGGILHSRKLARTLGEEITEMNRGQGLVANAVASLLVIVASRFGVPVSTTHVSCGAIFGVATARRQANWRLVGGIVLAWIATLPLAALLAAAIALATRLA